MSAATIRPGKGPLQALLLDLDGTLADSAEDLRRALNEVLRGRGLPEMSLAQVKSMIGDGAAKLVERGLAAAGGNPAEARDALSDFLAAYEGHAADATRPYPGVPDTLRALDGRGLKLAVVTNKPERAALEVLAALDLAPFFAVVVGGEPLLRSLARRSTLAASSRASAARSATRMALARSCAWADAMEEARSIMPSTVSFIAPIAPTASVVPSWIAWIWTAISSVAFAVWAASAFTSEATTAKTRPASPARAASMVASSASRFVCPAMDWISAITSPIRDALTLRDEIVRAAARASSPTLAATLNDSAVWPAIMRMARAMGARERRCGTSKAWRPLPPRCADWTRSSVRCDRTRTS